MNPFRGTRIIACVALTLMVACKVQSISGELSSIHDRLMSSVSESSYPITTYPVSTSKMVAAASHLVLETLSDVAAPVDDPEELKVDFPMLTFFLLSMCILTILFMIHFIVEHISQRKSLPHSIISFLCVLTLSILTRLKRDVDIYEHNFASYDASTYIPIVAVKPAPKTFACKVKSL